MWRKVKEKTLSLMTWLQCRFYMVPEGGKRVRKKPGGKEVIVEFVLMVVAVAVGYLFRDQIKNLITSLGTNVSDKITAMFGAS